VAQEQSSSVPSIWTCPRCGWTGQYPGMPSRCPQCRKAERLALAERQRGVVRQYTCKRCGWSGEIVGPTRCPPCVRRSNNAWRFNHRKRLSVYMRSYMREYLRGREAAGKHMERYQARMTWLKAGDVTWQQLREVYLRDGGACVYCGTPVSVSTRTSNPVGFDHVIPRMKGGCHTASNLVVCCRSCNSSKSTKLIE
jgi:predicted Zn-ribbon and HTH transcriptional regulator